MTPNIVDGQTERLGQNLCTDRTRSSAEVLRTAKRLDAAVRVVLGRSGCCNQDQRREQRARLLDALRQQLPE